MYWGSIIDVAITGSQGKLELVDNTEPVEPEREPSLGMGGEGGAPLGMVCEYSCWSGSGCRAVQDLVSNSKLKFRKLSDLSSPA